MSIDMKALRTFHRIAEQGSFIRAAEELNYAQSTITTQIQKLETEMGVQLFERGKKIQLTEAGRLFYAKSLPLLTQMEQLQEDMSALLKGRTGHVRLGVTEPTASYRLPAVLKAFQDLYPGIRISLEFGNTPLLSEKLLKGDLDLALCSAPGLEPELLFEQLFQEAFAVLMPKDHPLADEQVIEPSALLDYRLLITSAACPYRRKLETVLQEAGTIGLATMEIGSMTALAHYVAAGLGVALVPRITADPLPAGTVMRPVGGSLIAMTFGILRTTKGPFLHSAGHKLYHFLKEHLHSEE